MILTIEKEITIQNELLSKIKWACTFSNCEPKIKNGNLKRLEKLYAKERDIVFNVCPTSNIVLKRVKSFNEHPIRLMYDMGLKITINTDDLLIFNSTLSNEYLKLYNSKVFNAKELNEIRLKSLNY